MAEILLPPDALAEIRNSTRRGLVRKEVRLAQDVALLKAATKTAVNGAILYGHDIPIGSAVGRGNNLLSKYIASDRRLGEEALHAEVLALAAARLRGEDPSTLTVAVTMESCIKCQDYLAEEGVGRVIYAIPRYWVEQLGLINKREGITSRAERLNFPYEVTRVVDPELEAMNALLFRNTSRDPETGEVKIDQETLEKAMREYL